MSLRRKKTYFETVWHDGQNCALDQKSKGLNPDTASYYLWDFGHVTLCSKFQFLYPQKGDGNSNTAMFNTL